MRPDKFSFTIILSSPAHFVAELESAHFLLTHAWPGSPSVEVDWNPKSKHSRYFYALSFREKALTPEQEKQAQPPHYSFVGDYFSVFLSLYYGKRFDNLGFLLDHGLYCLPDIQPSRPKKSINALPFTSEPRKDLAIPLNFAGASALLPILHSVFSEVRRDIRVEDEVSPTLTLAFTAGRFYQQALQLYDSDPEFAFLSLISAGEVIVSGLQFDDDELYDCDLIELLAEIQLKAGTVSTEKIKKRLFQVRRKFTAGMIRLLNPAFFMGGESSQEFLNLKPENIGKHLKAAYDLRSRYLHIGTRFGSWVAQSYEGYGTSVGTPFYGDSEWKKLISNIPSLAGLERLIRFALLRFLHKYQCPIHTLLD